MALKVVPTKGNLIAMKKSLQHRMRRENMIFHSVIFRRQKI